MRNDAAMIHHISGENGLRNTQAFDFELLIGATITRLEDAKG
jgi:hypothetical protein